MFDNKDKYISENDLINKDVEDMTDEEWAEYCRVVNEKLKTHIYKSKEKEARKIRIISRVSVVISLISIVLSTTAIIISLIKILSR